MALNDVVFVKGQGGLGRPLAGEDHISGLLYYVPELGEGSFPLPTGFSDEDRIKAVFSLREAEALGIKGDYSTELLAEATITITAIEDEAASSINVSVGGSSIASVNFSVPPASIAAAATAIVSAINAGTGQHGYSAESLGGVITLFVKKTFGDGSPTPYPTVSIAKSPSEFLVSVTAQFDGGEDDPYIILWYHIAEFFRIQPKGVLYVGIYTAEDEPGFEEINIIQNYAGGKIRQLGIYTLADLETTLVDTIQARADILSMEHKPLSILLGANIESPLTGLVDLTESTNSNVSVVIGQDGNGLGSRLFEYAEKSITCLGASLGAVSRSKVSENIGWVKNFNMAANELDVIAFADGTYYKDVAESQLSDINDRHYIFLRKHIGINGSYFNDSYTADSETSDYSTIENNRTIDKAKRNIRTFILPELNGPLYVNPDDGTLSEDTIAYFTSLTSRPLEQMQRDGELSGFGVTINPAQDVLATSKLEISVALVPVGVARQILINIGFTVKLS